jgi:hypothetical protein
MTTIVVGSRAMNEPATHHRHAGTARSARRGRVDAAAGSAVTAFESA